MHKQGFTSVRAQACFPIHLEDIRLLPFVKFTHLLVKIVWQKVFFTKIIHFVKMHLSIFIFALVRARPNGNEEYPSYEICKFFQEDRIGEMYEALGLNNQWPRLEKDPQVDF